MTNTEKYIDIFTSVFSVEASVLNDTFTILDVENWDSVAHMTLIGELEDTFNIMLDTDDIIEFSSYTKGIEILKKYGVEF